MALTPNTASYVLAQTGKGLPLEQVVAKWNRCFPQQVTTEGEAQAFLSALAARAADRHGATYASIVATLIEEWQHPPVPPSPPELKVFRRRRKKE